MTTVDELPSIDLAKELYHQWIAEHVVICDGRRWCKPEAVARATLTGRARIVAYNHIASTGAGMVIRPVYASSPGGHLLDLPGAYITVVVELPEGAQPIWE